jgi:hypothetical protein
VDIRPDAGIAAVAGSGRAETLIVGVIPVSVEAVMATLAGVTNIPALALLGEDGKLEHGTEPCRRWFADKEELCKQSPELQRVLDGQANASKLKLDGVAVNIAAVSDRGGTRYVASFVSRNDMKRELTRT